MITSKQHCAFFYRFSLRFFFKITSVIIISPPAFFFFFFISGESSRLAVNCVHTRRSLPGHLLSRGPRVKRLSPLFGICCVLRLHVRDVQEQLELQGRKRHARVREAFEWLVFPASETTSDKRYRGREGVLLPLPSFTRVCNSAATARVFLPSRFFFFFCRPFFTVHRTCGFSVWWDIKISKKKIVL